MKLRRLNQCEKCPWKVSTNPREIPDGYSEAKHRALARTIADPDAPLLQPISGDLHVMACHEHHPDDEVHCVGWLMNQIGPGNNISLRIHMSDCENLDRVRLDGPQHERFEDTLP